MQRQEGVCSSLQPSYDEERVQCRDFPLSGIESSHIDSSGIESLRIDSSLIDPPIRRFPLNLVGFYVWRRITRATHESSETLDYPSIASRLGSSRLLPREWFGKKKLPARGQGKRGEQVKRQDYLVRSRNRAAVPMDSNAEGSTRLFPKIHLHLRTFDRRVDMKARERA